MGVLEKKFSFFRGGESNPFHRFDAEGLYNGFKIHPEKVTKVKGENSRKEAAGIGLGN